MFHSERTMLFAKIINLIIFPVSNPCQVAVVVVDDQTVQKWFKEERVDYLVWT